ncbi:hypothetical protein AC579_1582 [Pseudocercospora musae]|uniref:Large ribosomal subunit protein uL6 alpha-beta domain-containing protein n=1 Tax=Pseudocercospora musae TaxID=113226 RepID=A0A139GVR1_9PEZI|nr:hypothetical protein AC579_1582 [Pseudocercospora musae]
MAASRHCTRSSRALLNSFTTALSREITVPIFLVPAFAAQSHPPLSSPPSRLQSSRFSTSPRCASKIGRSPLTLPPEVKFTVTEAPQPSGTFRVSRNARGATVDIEGPRGKMSMSIPPYMQILSDNETRTHTLQIADTEDKKQKEMWGTVRAYLQNHILGVSEGHAAILRLVGVGYRATVEKDALTKQPEYPGQEFVSLKVGYSHPIELGVPQGVKASVPQPTRILLEGCEKEVVMQFAAEIRAWRRPEPYKGKGIFVNDETIRLKAKKIK